MTSKQADAMKRQVETLAIDQVGDLWRWITAYFMHRCADARRESEEER